MCARPEAVGARVGRDDCGDDAGLPGAEEEVHRLLCGGEELQEGGADRLTEGYGT
jgi:hypothetical protein